MIEKETIGACILCNKTFSYIDLGKHLEMCVQKQISALDKKRLQRQRTTLLLSVTGQHSLAYRTVQENTPPPYWMYLAVSGDAWLEELDLFLRILWLECCGHLSAFHIAGKSYLSSVSDPGDLSMEIPIKQLLKPGLLSRYAYDFGSTTELQVTTLSSLPGTTGDGAVRLLALNDPPHYSCSSCGKLATLICGQCSMDGAHCLCERCGRRHGCGMEMLLPIVNSPRLGVCGYTG